MSFATRIRQLASETAVYGLSTIVGRLINFLLVPFYTNVFEPDRYGVVVAIYTAFVFLNILYTYGLESAYLKYASGQQGRAQSPSVFATATASLLLSSLLLSVLLLAFPNPVGAAIGVGEQWFGLIRYAALILALDALAVVPFAELRLENKAFTFALVKLANIGVNVGLNVLFIVGFGWGIEAIFHANAAASAVTLLLLIPVFVRKLRGARVQGELWQTLLRFGLPFVPGGLGYALADRINIFFLANMSRDRVVALYGQHFDVSALEAKAAEAARLATLEGKNVVDAVNEAYGLYVAGVFGTAWKLGIFVMLLVQMFRFAWQPFFLQHASDPDAKRLFARIFTVLTAGLLLAFLGVSFFAQEIVSVPLPGNRHLIAEAYWFGLTIVPLSLAAYLFQGWYYAFSAGLYIEKQTRYFAHSTFAGSVVAVILNTLLVPRFGMMGAAWATVAAYATMAMTLFFFAQRAYPIVFDWRRVLTMVAAALGLFILWETVAPLQRWWVEIGLVLLFMVSLFAIGVLPRDLINRLRGNPQQAARDADAPMPQDVARPDDPSASTDPA